MEWYKGEYTISDNVEKINRETVFQLLKNTYWAKERGRKTLDESIRNSIVFGLYKHDQQIGFARAVSDRAVFSWLMDVVIDEKFRGDGLGKWLVGCILDHPAIQNTNVSLATEDAHGLYNQFGFVKRECMRRQGKNR